MVINVWLEITMRCNLRCGFCYNQFQAGGNDAFNALPSAEQVEAVLAQLTSRFEIGILTLAGGEPTASGHLRAILRSARGKCKSLIIATNGTLIDDDLAPALIADGVDTFQISLSGSSPAVHDAAVGLPGAFEKMLAGAIAIRSHNGRVVFVFVAGDDNCGELLPILDMAYLIGVGAVIVNQVRSRRDQVVMLGDRIILDKKRRFFEMLVNAAQRAKGYEIPIIVPTFLPGPLESRLKQFNSVFYNYSERGIPQIIVDILGRVRLCQGGGELKGGVADLTSEKISEWQGLRENCACAVEQHRLEKLPVTLYDEQAR